MHQQRVVVEEDGKPTTSVSFAYNPDLSGDILVVVERLGSDDHEGGELWVPGRAILELVGSRMREAAIASLEDAEWAEFTGGLTG